MQLQDGRIEFLCEGRGIRYLEGSGGDDHVPGKEIGCACDYVIALAAPAELIHFYAVLDWKVELRSITFQVISNFVFGWEIISGFWEWRTGKSIELAGCKQSQTFPGSRHEAPVRKFSSRMAKFWFCRAKK